MNGIKIGKELGDVAETTLRVGYQGLIEPDHTPGIDGDSVDTRIGWAFAIGQMIALRSAITAGN